MLRIVASIMTIIPMTLEVLFMLQESSIMLQENIYSVTHDDRHMMIKIFLYYRPQAAYFS